MDYIEAPEYLDFYPTPSIFLGGGITGCPDWQTQMVKLLNDEQGMLFNPRRANFDVNQEGVAKEQIKWEFDHLWKSDIVIFWFCKETVQPIVLLELGARLAHFVLDEKNSEPASEDITFGQIVPKCPDILIGIEKGYEREEDVLIQSELAFGFAPEISRSLEDLAARVKKIIQ